MMSVRAITASRCRNARRAHGSARRRWIARLFPLALLALIIQALAPVAASAMTAAAIASIDPFGGAVICHAEPGAAPSDRESDRTACGLDCVMCCVLHAAAAVDAPPAPAHAAPLRSTARIDWFAREFRLVRLVPWSQAQPRGPPPLS
ncbi:conserved exported hypothetical protein [Bradyrhizobium sp. ORS 375]|uniref:DUF2946 family protein n=1 Tax=Bradyrhizobium sp. (strain ORS 375) TaxID=566679 RepID=UPI0002405D2F|nr:DUF2946 family protein [Bradyrhizobium sp. ORS 375]CCD91212.1 conserved exported hypothetical protein [Bradyrhizobium sp. ORS 375]